MVVRSSVQAENGCRPSIKIQPAPSSARQTNRGVVGRTDESCPTRETVAFVSLGTPRKQFAANEVRNERKAREVFRRSSSFATCLLKPFERVAGHAHRECRAVRLEPWASVEKSPIDREVEPLSGPDLRGTGQQILPKRRRTSPPAVLLFRIIRWPSRPSIALIVHDDDRETRDTQRSRSSALRPHDGAMIPRRRSPGSRLAVGAL
jgi:hypothetical protein